jgi:hypothetical protein
MLIAEIVLAVAPAVMSAASTRLPPVTLEVSSPQQRSRSTVFQATRILDLRFDALFATRLRGHHLLEVRVFTPAGHLYQTLTVPFVGQPRALPSESSRRVEGYPRPLKVEGQQSVTLGGSTLFRVSAPLPVAGTWIVSSSLYGTWRAEAYVDGGRRAVASTAFSVRP